MTLPLYLGFSLMSMILVAVWNGFQPWELYSTLTELRNVPLFLTCRGFSLGMDAGFCQMHFLYHLL